MIVNNSIRVGVGVLSALLTIAVFGRAEDVPRTFADVKQEHERAYEAIMKRRELAKTDAEQEAVTAEAWARIKVDTNRALAWADAHPDDPAAIDAIVWTVHGLSNGYSAECAVERARAFTLLKEKGLASEKIVPVCYYSTVGAFVCPEEMQFLQAALTKSPSRLVRAAACLGLARTNHTIVTLALRSRDPITRKPLEQRWKGTDLVSRLYGVDPEELNRRAEAYFVRITDEFGDLKMPYPYNPTPFAEMARGELFELRGLGVGNLLPELEGEDVRGQKLPWSDYRGKVVAVVFWATWCGPCMGMVPHERELVKRMAGKPFVLLGVNGDDDRVKAAETMTKEKMSWPSLWNGSKMGGFVDKLGVRSWPTIYVIDAQGVIRYKNVRGESLDQAVDLLVKEAETGRK